MRIATLVLLSLALAACAQKVWQKPGASQQEYAMDQLTCTQYANDTAPPNNNLDVRVYGRVTDPIATVGTRDDNQGARHYIFDNCMKAKGWAITDVSD